MNDSGITILVLSAIAIALTGCSSTKLELSTAGRQIADSIGVEIDELKFVTNADIVETAHQETTESGERELMQAAPHQYSSQTKGIVAVSKDRIYWAWEGIEEMQAGDFASMSLEDIQAVQRIPDNALLMRTNTKDIIVRAHSWTKYAGDEHRFEQLRTALSDEGVPVILTEDEQERNIAPWSRTSWKDHQPFAGTGSSPVEQDDLIPDWAKTPEG